MAQLDYWDNLKTLLDAGLTVTHSEKEIHVIHNGSRPHLDLVGDLRVIWSTHPDWPRVRVLEVRPRRDEIFMPIHWAIFQPFLTSGGKMTITTENVTLSYNNDSQKDAIDVVKRENPTLKIHDEDVSWPENTPGGGQPGHAAAFTAAPSTRKEQP